MSVDESAQSAPRTSATKELTSAEFHGLITVDVPGTVQGVVFEGRGGALTSHVWNKRGLPFGEWAAQRVQDRTPAYYTPAAYEPGNVSDYKGRTAANVKAVRSFWVDVEGTEEKGGYAGGRAVLAAVRDFIKGTQLAPNILVFTGSGGVHLYYLLERPISRDEWLPRAGALVAVAGAHRFRIDSQVTTDAARVMRAPGSFHQKTGEPVKARRVREALYSLEEFDTLTGYTPSAGSLQPVPARQFVLTINGDVTGDHGAYSYVQAAKRCAAMQRAAQDGGAGTPYPVWILAVKTAELSTEGRDFAHQISAGHPDYEAGATDAKLDTLTGGPAGCATWANAYGAGGPCETCEYWGKIKNPAVQLGSLTDTSPPGNDGNGTEDAPPWVVELNQRFALARVGSRMAVVDFETPDNAGNGKARGFGYLDATAFHAMFNGRFAPLETPKDKPRALAAAWLSHPKRRQYEGVAFAPGKTLPADILNTWQGFAVEAVPGDVGPWLEVLGALVPSKTEREYVLRWLAWKVQNPGGVPDTILIFRGAKGTGKNSLFDPLLAAFGKHAMLADDPELIAGRFTGHLMSLSFAVLDEAVFVGDPRQADRIKSRVTAKVMHYEQKGMDPVAGTNRCAYVMLTNHTHVWQATTDERRAVVVDVGESLRGNLEFWKRYHQWASGHGPSAVLHHLQTVDLTGYNPRQIPKGEALRKQIELTALRDPAAAWWYQCLSEGSIRWRDGIKHLGEGDTEIERAYLRESYEQSAAARGRAVTDWAAVSRKLSDWAGPGGIAKTRKRTGSGREWVEVLAPLDFLRSRFTEQTKVRFDGGA